MPYQSVSELLGGTGDPLGRLLVDQATRLGIQGPRDGARVHVGEARHIPDRHHAAHAGI